MHRGRIKPWRGLKSARLPQTLVPHRHILKLGSSKSLPQPCDRGSKAVLDAKINTIFRIQNPQALDITDIVFLPTSFDFCHWSSSNHPSGARCSTTKLGGSKALNQWATQKMATMAWMVLFFFREFWVCEIMLWKMSLETICEWKHQPTTKNRLWLYHGSSES